MRALGAAAGLSLSLVLTGCGGGESGDGSVTAPPPRSAESAGEPDPPRSIPDLGLTPLPTPQQVQAISGGGRADPFAALPVPAASVQPGLGVEASDRSTASASSTSDVAPGSDPNSGVTLTGVLRVGGQQRALARSFLGSGVLCIGRDGRCEGDRGSLLPQGWSVLAIDVQRGCIRLARNGEPQAPLCMA